jgi:hypothetical protein
MIYRAPFAQAVLLSGLIIALNACKPGQGSPPFALQVDVSTDSNIPISAATILIDGASAGLTDASGKLRLTSAAAEGRVLTLSVKCPLGYVSGNESIPVALRRLATLDATQAQPTIRQRLVCNASEETSVVVVNVGRANLPVLVNDAMQATTNANGIAHVALRGKPNTAFTIALDTTAHPELHPQNPTRTFTLGKTPELFVFQQQIQGEKARPRRAYKKSAGAVPYRID